MVREKVTHYLKSLPKAWRNRVIPIPEVVTAFLETGPAQDAPLADALRGFLDERLARHAARGDLRRRRSCRRTCA